jgi:hypothetical protein
MTLPLNHGNEYMTLIADQLADDKARLARIAKQTAIREARQAKQALRNAFPQSANAVSVNSPLKPSARPIHELDNLIEAIWGGMNR